MRLSTFCGLHRDTEHFFNDIFSLVCTYKRNLVHVYCRGGLLLIRRVTVFENPYNRYHSPQILLENSLWIRIGWAWQKNGFTANPRIWALHKMFRNTNSEPEFFNTLKWPPEVVVVDVLWGKDSSKTQLSTNSPVCSMKNTSFSQNRI